MASARNAEYTKNYNRKLIIRLLLQSPMSRAELARKTGLTRQALSVIAEELLSDGLIYETVSTESQKGRTPIILQVKKGAYYAIGIYMSRTLCEIGLVDITGKLLISTSIAEISADSTEKTLKEIISTTEKIIAEASIPREKILGIGISTPGPADQKNGVILNPPGYERWHGKNLLRPIKEALDFDSLLENNAYSIAVYEKCYGNGKHLKNFMLALVDSGVGCGIISGGKLYRGAHRLSGELGHTSIDFAGERCSCGNYGCLELYAAIPNLLNRFGMSANSWEELIKKAKEGEPSALQILYREADYLTAGIVNSINLLDLEAVLLDGNILDAFELISPYMSSQINGRNINKHFGNITLLPAHKSSGCRIAAAANIIFADRFPL